MGWYAVAKALQARDPQYLREVLGGEVKAGEVNAGRSLELALREMGYGPVREDRHTPGALGLYHVWHWCVSHGEPFPHTQAACDAHRECAFVTIPVYRGHDVTPAGAVVHWPRSRAEHKWVAPREVP